MGKITSKDHGVNENVLSILNRILNISQQQILMHIDSMKRIFTICMMLGQMLLVTPKKLLAEEGAWIKSSPADVRVERVETTHWGIMAGEFDARVWKKPFNGILISKDLGESWKQVGLDERGVTDLDYKDGIIYATTYYFVDSIAGLFVSNDGGKNWEHKADNFSTSAVNTLNDTVILGTYSHGLWVSKDKGESWHQKLGDGYFGPKIYTIAVEKGIALASSENLTYVSYDLGSYWSVLPSLGGLKVRSITILEDMIFVGTANSGMYKSVDFGQTFSKVQSWESKSVGAINYYKGVLYASGKTTAGKYKVYSSTDFGKNWQDTNLNQTYNEGNINDLGFAFSTNQYLFATVPFDGLYKYTIPPPPQQIQPFLQIPWDAQSNNELIERVFSFFDHEYPLLAYPYHIEPISSQNTTVNYLGIRNSEPNLYYSGHDGVDFTLPYSTPVIAAANGIAQYGYDPNGLGYFITISHSNGLESTYAHLQETGLITKGDVVPVTVGQQVGKVGLSGNTTGPHLHFSVKDLNKQRPDGRIDPFGWQNLSKDPWPGYEWGDSLGNHVGSISSYLWNVIPETISKLVIGQTNLSLKNKDIILDQNGSAHNFTIFVQPYAHPKIPVSQNKLTYITGTSLLVNLYNMLGEPIPPLFEPATIEVDISSANLDEIDKNTLHIYFWNDKYQTWEKIPSIYNAVYRKVIGETKHFSHFAVFGKKISNEWVDMVKVEGARIQVM